MLPDLFSIRDPDRQWFHPGARCFGLLKRQPHAKAHSILLPSRRGQIGRDRRRCLLPGTEIFHVFWRVARAVAFVSVPAEFVRSPCRRPLFPPIARRIITLRLPHRETHSTP